MAITKKKTFGYIRDLMDSRDILFKTVKKNINMPQIVNLVDEQSPVEDQLNLGSCVGQALVGNLEYLLIKNAEKKHMMRKAQGINFYDLSRLFVYYNARKIDRTISQDAGTQIRSGIKSLASEGVCREDLWPYIIKDFARKPVTKCYEDAKQRLIKSYYRLVGINDMLNCIADGFPFVFGITVYSDFESNRVARTGIVRMPLRTESVIGGHAMLCTGFDQKLRLFDFKNSWDGWGFNNTGYGKIPFQYMEQLCSDAWVIKI